jgi:hypothetical protein
MPFWLIPAIEAKKRETLLLFIVLQHLAGQVDSREGEETRNMTVK